MHIHTKILFFAVLLTPIVAHAEMDAFTASLLHNVSDQKIYNEYERVRPKSWMDKPNYWTRSTQTHDEEGLNLNGPCNR